MPEAGWEPAEGFCSLLKASTFLIGKPPPFFAYIFCFGKRSHVGTAAHPLQMSAAAVAPEAVEDERKQMLEKLAGLLPPPVADVKRAVESVKVARRGGWHLCLQPEGEIQGLGPPEEDGAAAVPPWFQMALDPPFRLHCFASMLLLVLEDNINHERGLGGGESKRNACPCRRHRLPPCVHSSTPLVVLQRGVRIGRTKRGSPAPASCPNC
jgi:hypothetical protein